MPQEDATVATSDPIADIIGDYRAFAAMQRHRLVARGIDIAPYPLSHLAVRVADWDLYVHQRTLLERHARANSENVWNGRPISLRGLRSRSSSSSRLFTSASTGWVSSTSAWWSVRTSTTSHECIGPR